MTDNTDASEKLQAPVLKSPAFGFLRFLDPNAKSFHFQVFDDDKERSRLSKLKNKGRDPRAKTIVGTLDQCWPRLVAANQDGCGVFITINRVVGPRRIAEKVDLVRYHFVEIDGTNKLADILALPFKPAWINESSPGKYHVYFKIAPDVASDLATFSRRQTQLAVMYKAGLESKDLVRVMRLPGFLHQKNPANPWRVIPANIDRNAPAYSADEFAAVLGAVNAEARPERAEEPAAPEDAAARDAVIDYFKNRAPIAISDTVNPETGKQGNSTAFEVMCRARDEGVEQSTCFELALEFYNPRCDPEWSSEELKAIVENAYSYAQNTQAAKSAAADFNDDAAETVKPKGNEETIEEQKKARKKVRENFGLDVTEGTDIKPQVIDWMWEGYLARGNHTAIAGVQGDGKSQVVYSIAAAITTGGLWPGSTSERAPQGRVIVLNAEDRPEDMLVPRLMAAGADMRFITIINATRDTGSDKGRKFSLLTDLERLTAMANKRGDVKLISFDPVSSYLGGDIDSHSNTELRNALDPITAMAWKTNTAVISVTHFNKAGKGVNALNRVMGGAGFTAAPRAAFAVIRDAKDQLKRLLLPLKNNMSDENVKYGMEFTLSKKQVAEDERNGKPVVAPFVVWGNKTSITADEALAANNDRIRPPTKVEAAATFLTQLLADGPVPVSEVSVAARNAGIASAALRRAREDLGVISTKVSQLDGRGPWLMSLPDPADYSEGSDFEVGGEPGEPLTDDALIMSLMISTS